MISSGDKDGTMKKTARRMAVRDAPAVWIPTRDGLGHTAHKNPKSTTVAHIEKAIPIEQGSEENGMRAANESEAQNPSAMAHAAESIAKPTGGTTLTANRAARPKPIRKASIGAASALTNGERMGMRENTHAVTGNMGIFAAVVSENASVSGFMPPSKAKENHA